MPIAIKKFTLFTILAVGFSQSIVAREEVRQFSLQAIHLKERERIVGIDISLQGGAFVGVSGLPAGWLVTIDNDPSWQTTLKGDVKVGAAALDTGSIQKLVLTTRKFEFDDLKFRISGVLLVTRNFKYIRKIQLGIENLRENMPAQ